MKKVLLWSALLWLLSSDTLRAQSLQIGVESDRIGNPTEQPVAATSGGIPLPDIGTAAEALRQSAGKTSAWLALGDDAAGRLAEMTHFLNLVASSAEELDRLDIDAQDRQQIDEMRNRWRDYAERITEYQIKFSDYGSLLEARLGEFKQASSLWRITRSYAEQQQAIEVVLTDIDGALALIDPVLKQLIARRVPVSEFQSMLTHHSLMVADVRDQIELADRDFRRELIKISAPQIWSISTMAPGLHSRTNLPRLLLDTGLTFVETQWGFLLLHVICIVFAVSVAFWWRRQLDLLAVQEDHALKTLRNWLTRPVSVGLLAGLLAGIFLYQTRPVLLMNLSIVAMLLAAARLLSTHADSGVRLKLVALVSLGIGELLLSQIVTPTVGSRFLLMAENLIALWLVWKVLAQPPANFKTGRVGIVVWRLAHLAPVLLLIGVLANVIGALALTTLLVRGTSATLVAGVILYIVAVLAEGLVTHFLRHRQKRMSRLVRDHARGLESSINFLIRLIAFWLWIKTALRSFGLFEKFEQGAGQILSTPLTMGTFSVSASQVFGFVLVIIGAALLSRLVRLLLEDQVLARIQLPRGVAGAVSTISRYLILTVGFLAALSVAGVDLSQIGIIIGALGVGIGFGLQNVVGNFVSGLILVFERPIQIGDVVQVGALMGRVQQIGVRSSRVRTFDGSEVVLPNSDLVTRELTNWTLSDNRRRVDIPVITDLKVQPREIVALLERVATGQQHVLNDPGPRGLFEGAEEGFFKFILRFWVPFEQSIETKNHIAILVYEALEKAGFKVPDLPRRM